MWPPQDRKVLFNRLRDRRAERGLTQEELGHVVGLTRQSIIVFFNGRLTTSFYTALSLASALGVPVDDLFWLAAREEKP